jgi:fructokinase
VGEGTAGGAARGAIVFAGEALVDLAFGAGGALVPLIGGGPFTAARAAARLGADARFLGRLSTDRFGGQLRAALADDGVGLDAAAGTEDPTTLALVELDDAGVATYRFYVEGTSAPGLTKAALPDDAAVLCVGTLGLVFEPSASTLEALVAATPEDVMVAVDPNCRPVAIADAAAYRARLDRIVARADLVKASDADLAYLRPGTAPATAMRELLAPGAAGVVTLGADGALIVDGDAEPLAIPAPRIDLVDTIGAGDAFLGALLSRWTGDAATLREAVTFAVAVAARTCERAGSSPPTAAEMAA